VLQNKAWWSSIILVRHQSEQAFHFLCLQIEINVVEARSCWEARHRRHLNITQLLQCDIFQCQLTITIIHRLFTIT